MMLEFFPLVEATDDNRCGAQKAQTIMFKRTKSERASAAAEMVGGYSGLTILSS